ncbi:MAG: YkgJ family cysteine cluster protein [Syntrophobacterales bacterium]|nr:YkgJ family cysteine cluster protein [Syntrophobacterales bacterium]
MDEWELERLQEKLVNVLMKLRNTYGGALSTLHIKRSLPIEVKRLITKFFNLFDESCRAYIAYRHRVLGDLDKVRCKIGCSFCCYQIPYGASYLEYLYLYHGITEVAPGRLFLPALLDRNEVLSLIVYDLGETGNRSSYTEALISYSKRMIPCPFLDKRSALCLLYFFRPLSCRMHVSFAPPRFCDPLNHEPWRCGGVNIEPSDMLKEALNRVDEVFPYSLSRFLTIGVVEFMVNIMGCRPIRWEM